MDPTAGADSDAPSPTGPASSPMPAARPVNDESLAELSGLAASVKHPGVIFAITDSGGEPVVYGIDESGNTVARLSLAGARNYDWEGLTPGRPGAGQLLVGDIGDNGRTRSVIRLYRITEPDSLGDREVPWEAAELTYPDGAHNAEALLVDPETGEVVIITKDSPGGRIYRAVPEWGGRTGLRLAGEAPSTVTGGEYEPKPGGRMVVVNYLSIYSSNDGGITWSQALAPLQAQREAVAWPAEPAQWVWLGSEGPRAPIVPAPVPS